MDDSFLTIERQSTAETKVKGSRFIARTRIVHSVDEATACLDEIRKHEHAATHNCFGYRVGLGDEMSFKYSDDGEPSGTAGRPIYDIICGRELSNLLVVVTRYFGGTKLGTGGLVKAYSEAAALVVEQSGKKTNYLIDILGVEIEFPLYNQLLNAVHQYEARQVAADFSDRVSLKLEVRRSRTQRLIEALVELSGGAAKIEKS
jgi:uncharacterized YigZ family protein